MIGTTLHKGQRRALYSIPKAGWDNDEAAACLERPRTGIASRHSELVRLGLVDRDKSVIPWRYSVSVKGKQWLKNNDVQRAENAVWIPTDIEDSQERRRQSFRTPCFRLPAGTTPKTARMISTVLMLLFADIHGDVQR